MRISFGPNQASQLFINALQTEFTVRYCFESARVGVYLGFRVNSIYGECKGPKISMRTFEKRWVGQDSSLMGLFVGRPTLQDWHSWQSVHHFRTSSLMLCHKYRVLMIRVVALMPWWHISRKRSKMHLLRCSDITGRGFGCEVSQNKLILGSPMSVFT